MYTPKLLFYSCLILFLILPSAFAKSKDSPAALSRLNVIVEGNAPSLQGRTDQQRVAGMGDYYGIDYDCDGFGDSAFGSPFSAVSGERNAGSVNVVYGTGTGLKKRGNELWDLGKLGLSPRADDVFGFAVGSADIDEDGCTELIAGTPGRDVGLNFNIGAVYVLWGSKQGLQSSGFTELLGENADDFYGTSLSWGDFNNDDSFDIAGGAIGHQVGSKKAAGAVYVDYGPFLDPMFRQRWNLNTSNIKGKARPNDLWGFSLYSGNFNGDLYYDLAIGGPFGKIGSKDDVGFVNILYGGSTGLTSNGNQFVSATQKKKGDQVGHALSGCYCNNDSFEDLLISSIGYKNSTGIVYLLFGSNAGITSTGGQALLDPEGEEGDEFGASIGSIGLTGRFGLYFGSPGADVDDGTTVLDNAGVITLFGTVNFSTYEYKDRKEGLGLNLPRNSGDNFGRSLSVTANQNGYTTLLIAIPGSEVSGDDNAGAALTYRVDLSDYTKLTKPIIWDRRKLAGSPQENEFFSLKLGYQVRF